MMNDIQSPSSLDKIKESERVLEKANSNVVWDLLRQCGEFYEWSHYPDEDVYDPETHAQYYYHAHALGDGTRWPEHGHFHLFLRSEGIPKACKPLEMPEENKQKDADDLCHLISISMTQTGKPQKLFTVNRWVTGETWYEADDVCQMLDYFIVDHAWPSWPTNIWLTEMLKFHKEAIKKLVYERDAAVKAWQEKHPDQNVYEDRKLEVTSFLDL
jgi:hypothetical protein